MVLLAAAAQAQTVPCTAAPEQPECQPQEAPAPIVIPTPEDGGLYRVYVGVGILLSSVSVLLVTLKTVGILDAVLDRYKARTDELARYGHPHLDHHPEDDA